LAEGTLTGGDSLGGVPNGPGVSGTVGLTGTLEIFRDIASAWANRCNIPEAVPNLGGVSIGCNPLDVDGMVPNSCDLVNPESDDNGSLPVVAGLCPFASTALSGTEGRSGAGTENPKGALPRGEARVFRGDVRLVRGDLFFSLDAMSAASKRSRVFVTTVAGGYIVFCSPLQFAKCQANGTWFFLSPAKKSTFEICPGHMRSCCQAETS